MTPSEIDNMPAGPEMDQLIAEKVMGWKRHPKWHGQWIGREENPDTYSPTPFQLDWYPSTDILAAWAVVEKLSVPEIACRLTAHRPHTNMRYTCSFYTMSPFAGFIAKADEMPLAICRAALRVVLDKPNG